MRRLLATAAIIVLTGAAPSAAYHVDGSWAGSGDGGWDYASVDSTQHVVYVAHGAAITKFNLTDGTSRTIGQVVHAHAVVPLPQSNLLLVTSGADGSARLIDRATGMEEARFAVGKNPDAAIIDPATGHVLVMNADSGSVSEIDVAAKKLIRTIQVKAALEYAAIGPKRTLFINDEEANEIETLDLTSGRVGAPIALSGCEGPTGLGYDVRTNQLIAACANGKAAVVDASTRCLKTLVDIGRGADAVMVDAARRLTFIPCGRDGVLDVLSLDGGVKLLSTVKTEAGARTGALDPDTGNVYLPTARSSPPPAPGKRGAIEAGS